MHMRVIPIINFICWIAIDILNLLNETKLNYWFKHLLNCIILKRERKFINPAYHANKQTQ